MFFVLSLESLPNFGAFVFIWHEMNTICLPLVLSEPSDFWKFSIFIIQPLPQQKASSIMQWTLNIFHYSSTMGIISLYQTSSCRCLTWESPGTEDHSELPSYPAPSNSSRVIIYRSVICANVQVY